MKFTRKHIMAYDIRKKRVSPTLTFDLTDAEDAPLLNEDGTPCTATVHGPGSKKYVTAQAKRQSLLMSKIQRGKAPTLSADEQIKNNAEFLTDITEELDLDYVTDSGQSLKGREKLLAIYSDPELGFVGEQVLKKSGDWGNFSKKSDPS
jgi:hypothetical protein